VTFSTVMIRTENRRRLQSGIDEERRISAAIIATAKIGKRTSHEAAALARN